MHPQWTEFGQEDRKKINTPAGGGASAAAVAATAAQDVSIARKASGKAGKTKKPSNYPVNLSEATIEKARRRNVTRFVS